MAVQSPAIPLPSSLSWRLYETLIFLCCLTAVLRKNNKTKTPDLQTITDKEPKESFTCFVNKLAQVCDNKRGGDTVTAFAVLRPGPIEYRFAANRREEKDLEETRRYVEDLLMTLGAASTLVIRDASQRAALHCEVLGKIIAFNKPRISTYLRAFLKHVDFCIKGCEVEGTSTGERDPAALFGFTDLRAVISAIALSTAQDLHALRPLALHANKPGLGNSEFINVTRTLLQTINNCYHNEQFWELLREKTRQDRDVSNSTPWTEFYHALGRLQSYTIAVNVFLTARDRWPELFEDFTVTPIPSSLPLADPPRNIRRSAAGIMSRLTKDTTIQNSYTKHADYLQSLGLDANLFEKTKPRNFAPIIHAEVNLADSIIRSKTPSRARFFNEPIFGRYIGASKPTCRLCDLYFHAPSGPNIEVRKSHHNLYCNWRAADVYREDGFAAEQARNKVLESMVTGLRAQVEGTIVERLAVVKRHDSNTTTTDPVGSWGFGMGLERRVGEGDVDVDDLVSSMAEVDIDFRAAAQGLASSGGYGSEGEDDADDGGVRV